MAISTGGAAQPAIEYHYDVGRDFYRLWLGDGLVYSCGLWLGELDDDLETAQREKLKWHANAAGADGVARALDVGCGWGAMMAYLSEERHVGHVTGLTLSRDQASVAASSGRTEVRLEDWREHRPEAPYDAIVSIGAFEHFSRPDLTRPERCSIYKDFFDRCAGWLKEGGRLSLQTIGWEDFDPGKETGTSFFKEEIFPDSALPQLADVVQASEETFRVVAFRSDADHYAQTLRLWQQRLEANKAQAQELVGRETYRRYVRYLRISRAMFERRDCTLFRVAFERRAARPWQAPPGP
jgi:cyclopropane-fatty-acyl-phospholipid synthase